MNDVALSPEGDAFAVATTARAYWFSGGPDASQEKPSTFHGSRSIPFADMRDSIIDVSFKPTGERIASASADRTVRVDSRSMNQACFTSPSLPGIVTPWPPGLPPVFDPLAMRVFVGFRGLGWW